MIVQGAYTKLVRDKLRDDFVFTYLSPHKEKIRWYDKLVLPFIHPIVLLESLNDRRYVTIIKRWRGKTFVVDFFSL